MFDQMDKRLSDLSLMLARRSPSRSSFARIGAHLAGIAAHVSLPVERRGRRPTPPEHPQGGPPGQTGDKPGQRRGQTPPACQCTDPQYCWMHGSPCKCCNGTDSSCPTGTAAGSYWSYCCNHVLIYFRDCCGSANCPSGTPWCNNSSQPNWCGGAGGNRYVCTLAEAHGAC